MLGGGGSLALFWAPLKRKLGDSGGAVVLTLHCLIQCPCCRQGWRPSSMLDLANIATEGESAGYLCQTDFHWHMARVGLVFSKRFSILLAPLSLVLFLREADLAFLGGFFLYLLLVWGCKLLHLPVWNAWKAERKQGMHTLLFLVPKILSSSSFFFFFTFQSLPRYLLFYAQGFLIIEGKTWNNRTSPSWPEAQVFIINF